MVDVADLQNAMSLKGQLFNLQQALDTLTKSERQGRITRMTIASGDGIDPWWSVDIDTSFMSYPAQMLDAIRTQIQERINVIEDEMAQLGVT